MADRQKRPINTRSVVSPEEYAEMSGRVAAPDHLRVYFECRVDGHRTRFVMEVVPEMEGRAVRWCERQRRANHAEGAEIRVEPVYSVGRGGGWDD